MKCQDVFRGSTEKKPFSSYTARVPQVSRQ
eukprot:COSAG01_NODE_73434_length_245_cov_9.034247_1_plen_29_part_01